MSILNVDIKFVALLLIFVCSLSVIKMASTSSTSSQPSTSKGSPRKSASPKKSISPTKCSYSIETDKEMNTHLSLERGFKIPTLGIGTVFPDDENVEQAVEAALSIGYRHIDTAYLYNTEKAIGRILHEWISTKRLTREEIFVTSKLPFQGGHPDAVEPFLKKSLENLRLDYLDLYLIHFPVGFKYEGVDKFNPEPVPTDHEAIWKKMEEQVEAGRTKYIGLSNFNVKQIDRIMKTARINPVCLQVEMHVLFQQHELVQYCHNNNMVLIAYAPLGSPQLIKFKAHKTAKIAIPDLLNNDIVRKVAEKHNRTPAQILIRFLIQKEVCVIPKSSNVNRLRENFLALTFTLDENDMAALALLDEGDKGRIVDLANFFPQIIDHPEYPF